MTFSRNLGQKSERKSFSTLLGLALIGLAIAPGSKTWAATPSLAKAYRFSIPRQPVADALLELALEAEVSLGGDLGSCSGVSPALTGRYSLPGALSHVLGTSGCTAEVLASRTILIRRVAPRASPPLESTPQQKPSAAVELGELVVTSGRRVDLPGRTPYSITALAGTELEANGIKDLTTLADQVAGMTVTNLGPSRDKIFLRGMSDGAYTGQTQSTVGLYVDYVPITYNAPDPDLKLVDIDQVEVMRGPQGTLYGAGSIGGIVRIVTRKPDLDVWSAGISISGSTTQSGGPSHDLTATVNMPILAGRLAIRGSAYREASSGYVDDVNLGLRRINRFDRDGWRAALRGTINDEWSLTAGLIHQSIITADTQYSTVNLGHLKRANAVREPHDNDFDERYLTLEGRGSWGHVVASSASLSHHFTSRYDASLALPAFGVPSGVAALDDSQDINLLVNEMIVTSPQGGRWRWLAGGFLSSGNSVQETKLNQRPPQLGQRYGERRVDELSVVAAYGEGSYDLTDQLALVAGLRWFRFDFDVKSTVVQGGVRRDFSTTGHATGLSPKFAVRFQPRDDVLIYGQVSEGYRAGGANTAGPIDQIFDGGTGRPEHEFDPDEFWNYEIGTKLSLLDDHLHLRLAAFFADWRNIQTDQFLPSGLSYSVNVGDGTNSGIELEAAWRPSERWDLRAAGLLNDPQLTRRNPAFQSQSDAGLPGVAKVTASFGVSYHRPLQTGLVLKLDATTGYVGASYLTFDNQSRYRMGDYFSGRLQAALESDRWTASVFVDNPSNGQANTFAFGNPFRIGREAAITPQRPRTIGVKFDVRF